MLMPPRKPEITRKCEVCGKVIERRGSESHVTHAQRRYCSRECNGLGNRKYPDAPTKPPVPSKADDVQLEGDSFSGWEPESSSLPVAAGKLEIDHRGDLVVVVECTCEGRQHAFPWPLNRGASVGVLGLRQLCPSRGQRLIVLDASQERWNRGLLEAYRMTQSADCAHEPAEI
jgi:hypothetical protein